MAAAPDAAESLSRTLDDIVFGRSSILPGARPLPNTQSETRPRPAIAVVWLVGAAYGRGNSCTGVRHRPPVSASQQTNRSGARASSISCSIHSGTAGLKVRGTPRAAWRTRFGSHNPTAPYSPSILEARYICGDRTLFRRSHRALSARQVGGAKPKQFIATKLAERDERHFKSGERPLCCRARPSRTAKGGSCAISHTLFWIAKFLYGTNSPEELADKGAFSQEELKLFKKSEDLPVGGALAISHFITGREDGPTGLRAAGRETSRKAGLYLARSASGRQVDTLHETLISWSPKMSAISPASSAPSLEAKEMKEAAGPARRVAQAAPRQKPRKAPGAGCNSASTANRNQTSPGEDVFEARFRWT